MTSAAEISADRDEAVEGQTFVSPPPPFSSITENADLSYCTEGHYFIPLAVARLGFVFTKVEYGESGCSWGVRQHAGQFATNWPLMHKIPLKDKSWILQVLSKQQFEFGASIQDLPCIWW